MGKHSLRNMISGRYRKASVRDMIKGYSIASDNLLDNDVAVSMICVAAFAFSMLAIAI